MRPLPVVLLVRAPLALALPLLALAPGAAGPARAGEADVLDVDVFCRPAPGGRAASVCKFAVTVQHEDSGWDHYANRYEILTPDGTVLATRVLRHPHVEEQPFTRGISQVRIPYGVETVEVRAGDLVHGLGGKSMEVAIPHAKPPGEAGSPSEEPPS